MRRMAATVAAAAALACAAPGAQSAEDTADGSADGDQAGVDIELNKLEPSGAACRAYLVFQNRTDRSFDPYKLDLVMFDGEGVIAKRLAVEAGPLPAGKTSVKLFDINGLGCGNIDRILLNSVMACGSAGAGDGGGGGGDAPDCTALAQPSSRAKVAFLK